MAEAIGLISGVMGIWSFAADMLPSSGGGGSDTSAIRIHVGLDSTTNDNGDSLANAGGDVEVVRLYNAEHQLIGTGGAGTEVSSGEHVDISIGQTNGNQAAKAVVRAGKDAMCIAYMAATWTDGSRKYGWTGDWGSICGGLLGFPSGIELDVKDGGVNTPRCIWVDQDQSNDIEVRSIGVYWSAFRPGETEDLESLCGQEEGFQAWSGEDDTDQIAKRGLSPTKMRRNKIGDKLYPGRMDDRLVVSAIESHNATAECANELNYGPDFVSLSEETYCDMETRTTLPLCGGSLDSGGECFDLESSEGHQPAKRDMHKAPRGQAHSKKPTKVVNFGTRK